MKALAVGMAVVLAALSLGPGPAEATDVLRPTVLAPNPFAMTPPPAPLERRPALQVPAKPPHVHPGRPPVVAYPCCIAGYWAYQWVPTAYTTYVWMPGYVSAEGTLVGGGYYPQVVTGGYYQRVWVNGY